MKSNEYPDIAVIRHSFINAFKETNIEVYKVVSDVRYSGSTCVSLLTFGRKVYIANVGDSRVIKIS